MMSLSRSWLSLAQAVDVTGRSERTIQRWIATGRLDVVSVGGARYVNELRVLEVERDTRRAARQGRPGPRPRAHLTSDVVPSAQAGLSPAPERSPR